MDHQPFFLIVSVHNEYVYNLTALFLSKAPKNVEIVMDEITR